MPQRVKRVVTPLVNRLLFHAVMAVIVGLSGNLFVHFTFKIDIGDTPRFALENMVNYGVSLWDMFFQPGRLWVVASAITLYASVMSGPIHWLKHQAIAPCHDLAGIDNPDISWRRLWLRLPYRISYWVLSNIERLMVAWLMYITYLAHNPNQIVSWFKYMQNVKSPMRILSNPENLLGVTVFLFAIAAMASVFNLMVRRPHRKLGVRGGVLKAKK